MYTAIKIINSFICLCVCVSARTLAPSRAKPSKTFPVDTQIYEIHQPPAHIPRVGSAKNARNRYFREYGILGLRNLTRGDP